MRRALPCKATPLPKRRPRARLSMPDYPVRSHSSRHPNFTRSFHGNLSFFLPSVNWTCSRAHLDLIQVSEHSFTPVNQPTSFWRHRCLWLPSMARKSTPPTTHPIELDLTFDPTCVPRISSTRVQPRTKPPAFASARLVYADNSTGPSNVNQKRRPAGS
jgi:hypothetical protein